MNSWTTVQKSPSIFSSGGTESWNNQEFQNNRITPEAKYALLLSSKPQLIHKFSLKIIADYLGMTPETLSRVRRKMLS